MLSSLLCRLLELDKLAAGRQGRLSSILLRSFLRAYRRRGLLRVLVAAGRDSVVATASGESEGHHQCKGYIDQK